jgi:hypothetical protein
MPPLAAWARFARLPLPPLRGPPTPACEGGQVQEGEKPVPSPDPAPDPDLDPDPDIRRTPIPACGGCIVFSANSY